MSLSSTRLLLVAASALLPLAGCSKKAPDAAAPASTPAATTAANPQVGGQDVVVLNRKATDPAKPEFLSATVFPGRGMNLFQITANLPGKGVISVFASPSVADAAAKLNGGPQDPGGTASTSFGGGFLVPYPNRILGPISPDGKTIAATWHGQTIQLPADWAGKNPGAPKHSIHGLILNAKTDGVKVSDTADGQTVTGTIPAANFNGPWFGKTNLDFTIALAGDSVTATITATNVGDTPEPMAIGWHPYFAIPSGDRTQARLHIPADKMAVVNNYDDTFPTGQIVPVKGTKYDYTAPDGAALGDNFLDDNFSTLHRTDGAVDVTVTDPASHYGIHVLGLSPEIKTVQVYAPPTRQLIAVEEQFNFADPFGTEWKGMDTGMVTLAPGKSVTWKVKLALFTPKS
jgi:aldose 1-epimerase